MVPLRFLFIGKKLLLTYFICRVSTLSKNLIWCFIICIKNVLNVKFPKFMSSNLYFIKAESLNPIVYSWISHWKIKTLLNQLTISQNNKLKPNNLKRKPVSLSFKLISYWSLKFSSIIFIKAQKASNLILIHHLKSSISIANH
jgi:hypothetical protein